MIKRGVVFVSILLACVSQGLGQANIKEEVYVHLSSTDLIVGETLYFSGYTFSALDKKLSSLSRILYIELLDENGTQVFQSKVVQKGGLGNGEYFVPADLETGNYHFVAYTRWMRNFGEFFHQSVTIINPYKKPTFEDSIPDEVNFKFFPEGGKLLADEKNKVVIKVDDRYGNGLKVRGKILDAAGETLKELTTDDYGFSGFLWEPVADTQYQMLIEHDDQFHFFELPRPCQTCTRLNVRSKDEYFIASIRSEGFDEFTIGNLDIYRAEQMVYSKPITLNTGIVIPRQEVPGGLLKMVVSLDGKIKNERLLWNGTWDLEKKPAVGHFESLERVNVSIPVSSSSNLSVSVERVREKTSKVSLGPGYEIDSRIDLNLPFQFYASANEESLEDLLIASKRTSNDIVPDSVEFLPEFRSGLIQGEVVSPEGVSKENIAVKLSFAGSEYLLNAATTNHKGKFILAYNPELVNGEGYVDFVSELRSETLEIKMAQEFYEDYPDFPKQPILFDSLRIREVIRRSIENQIENAYFLPEKIPEGGRLDLQIGGLKSYWLDQYNRFSAIRDTFIELITEVGVSKNENKFQFNIHTVDKNFGEKPQKTLLLLDGAFVSAEEILNISPYDIERIDVLNRNYYFGKVMFNGIIAFHSFTGDLGETKDESTKLTLKQAQTARNQPVQLAAPSSVPHIPQYQDLLYWNPGIHHDGGALDISFYASEAKGLFEIRLEGVSEAGELISRRRYFEVR